MKGMEELERLANSATKGPWETDNPNYEMVAGRDKKGAYLYVADCDVPGSTDKSERKNAAYIAAASPDVILSLIRELKITQHALRTSAAGYANAKGIGPVGAEMYIKLAKKSAARELYPETE